MFELHDLILRNATREEIDSLSYQVVKTTYEWSTKHEGVLLCLGSFDDATGMLKNAVVCNREVDSNGCNQLEQEWSLILTSLFCDEDKLPDCSCFCERNAIDENSFTNRDLIYIYNGMFLKCVGKK